MLGLARLALEHVHRHLFVACTFLGEQHPDCPDIGTAVETVEDDPSHFIPSAWPSRDRGDCLTSAEAHLRGLIRPFAWSENAREAVISIPHCETVNGSHWRDQRLCADDPRACRCSDLLEVCGYDPDPSTSISAQQLRDSSR